MWKVEYSKRFLKELARIAKNVQSRIENIVFQELKSENPFSLGYLEKMTGYINKYKIRAGDYRVGVSVDSKAKTITCQRVAHRREIYRIFP